MQSAADHESDSSSDDDGVDRLTVEDGLSELTLQALKQHLDDASREKEWVVGSSKEIYNMSQFWYDDITSKALIEEALIACKANDDSKIAILSAPSLMNPIKGDEAALQKVTLLEYDDRFGVSHPDNFFKYDFREPEFVPDHLVGKCDVLVLDPPYLNMDTLREYFVSANLLARHTLEGPSSSCSASNEQDDSEQQQEQEQREEATFTHLIVVTAARLESDIREEFGLRPTTLEITHTSKLGNPLLCYTNYPPKHLGRWVDDEE